MVSHRGAWIFVAGLTLLAISITVGVLRHNKRVDAQDERATEKRGRYELLLQETNSEPPRFDISFVEFKLGDFPRLSARYRVVPTDVAKRLRTRRPTLHPDLWRVRRQPEDVFARGQREGRVREHSTSVVALVVAQTTPGRARLRLHVKRLTLRAYQEIFDLADMTPWSPGAETQAERQLIGSSSNERVDWTSNATSAAWLVPLAVLHSFRFDGTEANSDLTDVTHGSYGMQVATSLILLPRQLVVRDRGRTIRLPLEDALALPVLLGDFPVSS